MVGKGEKEDDKIVSDLIRIPAKNLEKRIKSLENEIRERLAIQESVTSQMDQQLSHAQAKLNRFKYQEITGPGSSSLRQIENQILGLERDKANEARSAFRDLGELRKCLQEAREELDSHKQRSKLLDI